MSKKIIKSEIRINNVLFWLCFVVTLMAIFMALLEFFSRGSYPLSGISVFYIGILIIYALHKEAIRILNESSKTRNTKKGELFVYIWILMAAGLHLINFLTKNLYSFSATGQKLNALTSISFTALEVGTVFILTRIIKLIIIKVIHKNGK